MLIVPESLTVKSVVSGYQFGRGAVKTICSCRWTRIWTAFPRPKLDPRGLPLLYRSVQLSTHFEN